MSSTAGTISLQFLHHPAPMSTAYVVPSGKQNSTQEDGLCRSVYVLSKRILAIQPSAITTISRKVAPYTPGYIVSIQKQSCEVPIRTHSVH